MQVNAIQSSLGFTGGNRRSNNKIKTVKNSEPYSRENPYNNNVSNRGMRNAAKSMILGLILLPAGSSVLSSCDSDAEAEAYAYADAQATAAASDSLCCQCTNGKDTITVHDTITQIIEHNDTVWIQKGYDSPVIDALRDFFEANDIPLGDERIPLKITWVDEQNVPAYYNQVFDGESSSYNEMNYEVEKTPWDDETGSFIIGYNDTYENFRYSLTSDGKLMISRYLPRDSSEKPAAIGDWLYSSSAVYDIDKDGKCVYRYNVDDDGNRVYNGTFQPGETENTILVTNPYGTEWRYTNVKVVTGDAPEEDDDD